MDHIPEFTVDIRSMTESTTRPDLDEELEILRRRTNRREVNSRRRTWTGFDSRLGVGV